MLYAVYARAQVNEIKRNIDRVSESLQVKRQQREIVESLQQAAGVTDSTVPAGAKGMRC